MNNNAQNLRKLLEHLGCQDIDTAVEDLYGLNHPVNIARQYTHFGCLKGNQAISVKNMVEKYTRTTCSPKTEQKPTVERQVTNRKSVKHSFDLLDTMSNHDLPFSEVATQVTLHPYNAHCIVIEDNNRYYKVPKPIHMELPVVRTANIKVRKTKHKGFLSIVETRR